MDETRLKDELIARLSCQVDQGILQVVDGALAAVLRDYDVQKRETALSTSVVQFQELELFIAKLRFDNYSKSTITQYEKFLKGMLVYIGKPVKEIQDFDIVNCLNAYEDMTGISASTKNHKRLIASSFFRLSSWTGIYQQKPYGKH